MSAEVVAPGPRAEIVQAGDEVRAALHGRWTADQAARVENLAAEIAAEAAYGRRVLIDLAGVERLDTLGAWVLDRTRHDLAAQGLSADLVGAGQEQRLLLQEAAYHGFAEAPAPRRGGARAFLEDVGRSVAHAGRDLMGGVSFLGEVVAATGRVILNPARFRGTSVVNQVEAIAFRGVPIIMLISFLVGGIVAQQGIVQLQRFGAQAFVTDLMGLLVLRELGPLLTAIMVAGRSGSAFTAEIGSMRMREEVDALRVMGLDPVEVLIVPRVLALVIGLPLLTFLSMLAALFGGGLTIWSYGGISPDAFLSRLQLVITASHFTIGMIKAPFMALVIGVIASIEGLRVEGSAESLGHHVTASVVKAIFMMIVLDGLFAMFFAAMRL